VTACGRGELEGWRDRADGLLIFLVDGVESCLKWSGVGKYHARAEVFGRVKTSGVERIQIQDTVGFGRMG